MKKIKKLFFSLILLLFYANIANATTKGTYVVEKDNTSKGFLVFVGICLIIFIISWGYRLDKKDEIKRKREKIKKSDKENNNLNNNDEEIKTLEDLPTINQPKATQDTVMINFANLKKMEKRSIEYNKINNDKYYEPKERVIEHNIDMKPEKKSIMKEQIDYTIEIKKIDDNRKENSDIDEDLELLELEETIKAANIRRYTRKKKKNTKCYTRKNIKVETETKKKEKSEKVEIQKDIKTTKRGRGRPKKAESLIIDETPKKRGRPRKTK